MGKVTLLYKAEEVGPVCQRLSKAAELAGLAKFEIGHVTPSTYVNMPSGVVVRWGTYIGSVTAKTQINSSTAIVLARDKKGSRKAMGTLSPKTFYTAESAHYPAVVRPRRHHAAKKFFVVKNHAQLMTAQKKCGLGWYGSELIDKDREFRVFVLHGRIVAVSERFSGDSTSPAWNLAAGGKLINCKYTQWSIPVVKAAIEATAKLGLDFSAMDIAIEKGTGRVVVFEANTAPGLRNKFTLACIAKAFAWNLDHEKPKAVIAGASKWKQFVHPAVKPEG